MAPPPDKREPKRPQPIESYRWFFVVDKARRGSMSSAKLESLIEKRTHRDRGEDTSFSGVLKRRVLRLVRLSFPLWGPAEWLLTFAIGLTLVGALATPGGRKTEISTDPHFTNATQMVRSYETGKQPWQRNYREPVYSAALNELSLVEDGSPWSREARRMSQEIKDRIVSFDQRVEAQRGAQLLRSIEPRGQAGAGAASKPPASADKRPGGRVSQGGLP